MNHVPEAAGSDGAFDPRQAAALLDQTTRQARRQLQPAPPWLLAARAVMVLAALGAIWLSVRGQHPYRGPTTADILVLIAFIVVNFTATVAVRQRATSGVRGRTPLRPAEITIAALGWVAAAVVIVALAAAGVSFSRYPTTVLITPGLAWAAVMAVRADWRNCAAGIAIALVGGVGLVAGPAGAWAVAGIGLCAVLLGSAAASSRRPRA
ncbi:MAG TPA: hypothetical protein VGM14_20880 [Streptosporangiaceae bacterium]|jgi:hypothetical protein